MTSLTPDQIETVREVVDESVRVSIALGIDESKVAAFLKNAVDFLIGNRVFLADVPYLIILHLDNPPSGGVLDSATVLTNISGGNHVFLVDENLKLVRAHNEVASFSKGLELSASWKCLAIYVEKSFYNVCMKGHSSGSEIGTNLNPLTVGKHDRPFGELPRMLEDHYRHALYNEAEVKYWRKKDKRILIGLPQSKTEEIFHRSLLFWLNLFVADQVAIYAEPDGLGQLKTDIVVTTADGASHLVEVKWLGQNESKTVYDASRITEGMEQVKIYLDKGSFVDGHAVFYDARDEEESKEKGYDKTSKHENCHEPHFVFLESETPSVSAKKITKRKALKA